MVDKDISMVITLYGLVLKPYTLQSNLIRTILSGSEMKLHW